MTKLAILDCETNDLPDYKKPADDPCQPRLASLAIICLDLAEDGTVTDEREFQFKIKPNGWEMKPGAGAVNGLTTEDLLANGEDLIGVLATYTNLIMLGYVVASFGAQHDCKIMRGELRRSGMDDLFIQTPNICLMRACHPFKIPKASGKGGWPKLSDACAYFGIEPEPMPHEAINGARCAKGVLLGLVKRGALPKPEVHFAKEKPTALT